MAIAEVGDSVWYFDKTMPESQEPWPALAATITRVDAPSADYVNLFLMTYKGVATQVNGVHMVPFGEVSTEDRYCTWSARQKATIDLIETPPVTATAVKVEAKPAAKPADAKPAK